MKFSKYSVKTAEDVLGELKTSVVGLSKNEAVERLKIYGTNEIKERRSGLFGIFLRQFKSPFFYLLFIASLVAFLIGGKIDGWVILIFVFINVSLGFFQEARAEKAVSLLKKYIPPIVKVLRNGAEENIDKKFLVPGDAILLKAGDIIPADLRALEVENFLIDESVLTGESAPVPKDAEALEQETEEIFQAKNIFFAGTSVISGKAKGVVIGTSKNTVFGGITKLVSGIARESAYEKEVFEFSKIILRTVVITITVIFLLLLAIRGAATFFEILIFSVALIVSIIPEALPVVITFAFSQGAMKLAKEKVVVRRLSAVEDLGNIEILCVDKTGTLTQNKLRLKKIFGKNKEKNLLYALLTSECDKEKISFNPFNSALYESAPQSIRHSLNKFKKIQEIPFDFHRLIDSVLVENEEGKLILISKGAPEAILERSSRFEEELSISEFLEKIKKEGKEGKKVLAVAFKELNGRKFSEDDEKDMTFLGYFSFEDPIKETAEEAMMTAKKLGVRIKMLTGDSKEVAGFVAKEFNLIKNADEVILGENLRQLSEEDFFETCENFSVFARISPEIKLKIIKALQKKYSVGFLGEGINDTPALKAADVGIVVREAADVPRQAADIVLLEKSLEAIIDGIKNGRNIFSNINKYIKCVLASNFGNFYSIAVISLFVNFLPMLPVQILLGNLLSDFPLIAITTDSVDVEELRRPKSYQLKHFIKLIIYLALISTIFDFIFFGIFYGILYRNQPPILQSLWFIESILTELALIFIIRTRHFFLKAKKPSWILTALVLADAVFIVALPFAGFGKRFFHFVAPPISAMLIVFLLVSSYFVISEMVKLSYFRRWRENLEFNKNP